MQLDIKPGKYVLAVSGGVDSMVLLDLLSNYRDCEIIVAHFDHGIRPDSHKDEAFVRKAAGMYGLVFESAAGKLGPNASEEAARAARYEFLAATQTKYEAAAIVTAHHQDDLLETAIINVLRGTGPRGLAAISLNARVIRPLLRYKKAELMDYAKAKHLAWHEDATNSSDDYLRNFVRRNLLANISQPERDELLSNIKKVERIERESLALVQSISEKVESDFVVDRQSFASLPVALGDELIVHWLRRLGVPSYDKKTVGRLHAALRVSKAGTWHPVKENLRLEIHSKTARFVQ